MSRTNKIIKNGKVGTFFFLIITILGFYSRNIFLTHLGDEFMGLTATLLSFLSFLNLLELGVGTAMGFAMYKPMFEKGYDRINELFSLISYLYRRIGIIVLILGVILSFFFPLIFSKTSINIYLIYYVFYIYLFSNLTNYFYNYHLMLLQADQKAYISIYYQQSLHILKIVSQIIILYYTSSYVLFVTVELIGIFIFNILTRKRIKNEYPWLSFSYSNDKSLLSKNKDLILKIKQLMVHKIGEFVLFSTDNIVIFSFVNLQSVTYIANYYIITGSSTTLLSNFLAGTAPAVGNLVAENDKQKIKKVFWELMNLNHFVGGILVLSLYYGVNPVIAMWLGDKYIMEPHVVMLILANLFIMRMRVPIDEFRNAYGLFHDTWAPIAEAILNLVISIILAKYYGIAGVLLGTFISVTLIALIWKPYFLYKNGFNENMVTYWKGFFVLLFSFIITFLISNYIINLFFKIDTSSFITLIFSLLKIGAFLLFIYISIMYILNKSFRSLSVRFINIIKVMLNKNL